MALTNQEILDAIAEKSVMEIVDFSSAAGASPAAAGAATRK